MKTYIFFILFFSSLCFASEKWMAFSNTSVNTNSNVQMKKPKSSIGDIKSLKSNIQSLKRVEDIKLENKVNPNVIPKISKKHQIKVEYFANSKIIKKKSSYLANVKDGAYIEYYSNGVVMLKSHYLNGKKHGVETIYDDTGKVYRKYFYINGVKQKDK